MTYASIMVSLQLGQTNLGTLRTAADLAERFGAHVLGVAMCQPINVSFSDAYPVSDLAVHDRETRLQEMAAAEAEVRDAMRNHPMFLCWHASMTTGNLAAAIANHARGADLVIATADRSRSYFETSRPLRVADLVMQLGRPVLVVPSTAENLLLDHVLVGWKDGPEARRAVSNGLSLLDKALRVTVLEIATGTDLPEARSRLNQVSEWLGRHGVHARPLPIASTGYDAGRFALVAANHCADLIVAGAYAHSRFQEWVFCGVARDLLLHSEICAIVSHCHPVLSRGRECISWLWQRITTARWPMMALWHRRRSPP
jgi:nucleotide-binding universal stress UspA family protein